MEASSTAPRKVVKVESVAAVLALHWFVARDEGLFAAEGLDVEIVAPPTPTPFPPGDPRLVDPRLVDPFNYQNFFEQNACDVFRGCEWGQIRRADSTLSVTDKPEDILVVVAGGDGSQSQYIHVWGQSTPEGGSTRSVTKVIRD
jgi:hypothetical protein